MRKGYLKSTRFVLFVAVSILLAVSVSLLISGCKGKEDPKASGESSLEMSKEALKGRLGDPELIVIDVRMAKAWEDCDSKITGARREDPAKLSTWTEHYAKDKTIVLYCSCDNEGTSKHVVKQLRSEGFEDAYALTGGWKAWIEADYPTEKKS